MHRSIWNKTHITYSIKHITLQIDLIPHSLSSQLFTYSIKMPGNQAFIYGMNIEVKFISVSCSILLSLTFWSPLTWVAGFKTWSAMAAPFFCLPVFFLNEEFWICHNPNQGNTNWSYMCHLSRNLNLLIPAQAPVLIICYILQPSSFVLTKVLRFRLTLRCL